MGAGSRVGGAMCAKSVLLAAAVALAVQSAGASTPLPESGELTCLRAFLEECTYADPASGLVVSLPIDWPVRRLKILTETGPAARARQRDAIRWLSIEYLPDDAANPEASLFQLTVLRRSDWVTQSGRPAPPSGVEVANGPDVVAVATLPPANPYPPGTRDADIFDALLPTAVDISRNVQFPKRPASE
jgi:hypothetical protein